MSNICLHFLISGRVQGVFFRDSTRRKAQELGVKGWVRNTHDGKVEVVACGSEDKIQELQAWLNHGPAAAEVEDVSLQSLDWQDHEDFVVK